MVKQSNRTSEVTKEKSVGILQILIYWVVIPLLFASAVLLVLAKFADVNVFDKAKEVSSNLPIISEEKKKDEDSGMGDPVLEERVVTLQAEIQAKEAELFKIKDELGKSDDEKKKLLIEQDKLIEKIAVLTREKDDTKKEFREITTTFEQMSAKSAAPVIVQMGDKDAIRILTSMKPDVLAAILEKMTPKDAAKYTTMMTSSK